MVLLNHFRNIFFVTFENVDHPNFFLKALYSVTGLGHQAVIVFFVLSGFFISNSIFKKIYYNKWSWSIYLIDRLTRLYVVLIPVLIIGYLIDFLGSTFLDYSFFSRNVDGNLNLLTFVGNLLFLQEIFVPVLGSNDPLWSLTYEFWYYILFPFILLIFVSKKSSMKVIYSILSISLITILFIKNENILYYFIIWLLGGVTLLLPYFSVKKDKKKMLIKIFSLFSFLTLLIINRLNLLHSIYIMDLLLSITFCILIFNIVHLKIPFTLKKKQKHFYFVFTKNISSFSFTLYLIHFPILIFLYAFFNTFGIYKIQPTLLNIVYGAIICFTVVMIAYAFSLITEKKVNQVRKLILKKMNKDMLDKTDTSNLKLKNNFK